MRRPVASVAANVTLSMVASNVTDKKFPGNPTEPYRTTHPLRVVGELDGWEGHSPEVLQRMLDGLTRLRAQGLDLNED